MTAPTTLALTQSLEDAQAAMLAGQKSMDTLTLHYIVNTSFAAELRTCYQQLETEIENIDVLRATGSKLDAICNHVLPDGRVLGDYATADLTFLTDYPALADITIPAGTQAYALTEDGSRMLFQTTEEGTIVTGQSEASIAARAAVRGITGNIAAYDIMALVSRVINVTAVENRLPFEGGTADETDDELRERYFDAIQAPGRATITMLERALNDISAVAEAQVVSYGQGDIGVLLDLSDGIEEVSDDVVDCLEENVAAGIQARGTLGATIDSSSVNILIDDVYGGLVWARPRCHIVNEDIFTITYQDMALQSQTATFTIPAGTHRGAIIAGVMASEESRAKKVLTVTPSHAPGGYSVNELVNETPDGFLTIFTVDFPFLVDSETVYLNGVAMNMGSDYTTVPGTGTIEILWSPIPDWGIGDEIRVSYTYAEAGYLYDILLGMGDPAKPTYLYNLPELVAVAVDVSLVLTETPETDLLENIEASLTAFLGAFIIGERLEFSDVLRFIQNEFDLTAVDYIGRPFIGIEEIQSVLVSCEGQVAQEMGDRITVEEDWRVEAGVISVEEA